MRYWLMKSEPDDVSIDDLAQRPGQTVPWYGVRNYQMRNRMIQLGYTAAKGALNFVDDDYIEPFAFSADACR